MPCEKRCSKCTANPSYRERFTEDCALRFRRSALLTTPVSQAFLEMTETNANHRSPTHCQNWSVPMRFGPEVIIVPVIFGTIAYVVWVMVNGWQRRFQMKLATDFNSRLLDR